MTWNSSNESLPSPSRSNLQIIVRHSSTPSSCDPSLLNVRLRLAGVINVVVVVSSADDEAYIPQSSPRLLLPYGRYQARPIGRANGAPALGPRKAGPPR
ncbi:hypothetical protein D1007_33385 [Hordeum vulgare]|nr:hypothetical protein D1007_33385 [Hordeum vulgare]